MPASDPDSYDESLPAAATAPPWPLLSRLPTLIETALARGEAYRVFLREGTEELKARFQAEEPVEELVHARAALVDTLLRHVWREHFAADDARWALIAVGGYGRGELHPCSDIDLLLLVAAPLDEVQRAQVERFVAFLWDIGLEVGHSVRTIAQCAEESAADVSVMTTLLDARLLAGSEPLLGGMRAALGPENLWPKREFFEAKVREQVQ